MQLQHFLQIIAFLTSAIVFALYFPPFLILSGFWAIEIFLEN